MIGKRKSQLFAVGVALLAARSDAFSTTSKCHRRVFANDVATSHHPVQPSTVLVRSPTQSRTTLHSKSSEGSSSNDEKSKLYSLLETGRDQKPNRGNFFYNDEVSSHLYGYVYLVGFFAAQDPIFLGSFFLLAGLAALATQGNYLPANPRVPASVAAISFAITILCRYGLGLELPIQDMMGGFYQGPTEFALPFEFAITFLNILWGLFGTWQTKEQRNGATYGF